MKNMVLAHEVLREVWSVGVREIVLCAGARNAPFVASLSGETSFRVHPFFEERSGAFFALGKILSSGRPVAVITTSGTAAAELLPAAIEADYQGLPLILVSADRPRRYRGSGAPQTINQIGLYSHYVENSWDIEDSFSAELQWSRRRPIHLNISFDEPLIDGPVEMVPASFSLERSDKEKEAGTFSRTAVARVEIAGSRPLILVGGLPAVWREQVVEILRSWKRPVLLEAPSNLRGDPRLLDYEIRGADHSLKALDYDSVIRIGSVPTLRLWRDLETKSIPVTHFSHLPFSGLPRTPHVFALEGLIEAETAFTPWTEAERLRDRERAAIDRHLFKMHPMSEPAWVEWLSREMPDNARVFIGNSLPIREWDFAATRDGHREVFANRGVNGIDGLISTFLGLADRQCSNWCVIGDLSALYDLSGPWPNRREQLTDLNLVIINNGGGKIFERLFRNSLFENPHDLNFKSWAEMWGWDYERVDWPCALTKNSGRPRVIEVIPSSAATAQFWKAWETSQ